MLCINTRLYWTDRCDRRDWRNRAYRTDRRDWRNRAYRTCFRNRDVVCLLYARCSWL